MKRIHTLGLIAFFALIVSAPAMRAQELLELPKSPLPYGHPMLLYLKSSQPIPEAHARCLRYIERAIDRRYGYYSSYGISMDMTLRENALQNLRNTVATDWGVSSRSVYRRLNAQAKAKLDEAAQAIASEKAELTSLTHGRNLTSDDVQRTMQPGNLSDTDQYAIRLLNLLGIVNQQKGFANAEALYENTHMFLLYTECTLKNDLPATIKD